MCVFFGVMIIWQINGELNFLNHKKCYKNILTLLKIVLKKKQFIPSYRHKSVKVVQIEQIDFCLYSTLHTVV